jgi:hypothetical protein
MREVFFFFFFSGELDITFCGDNCNGILSDGGNNKAAYFPDATDFRAVVHLGVGHGINFSYTGKQH